MKNFAHICPSLLLVLAGHCHAADSEKAPLRETYIRCAAIFGATGIAAEDPKRSDAYVGGALLFALWASRLDEAAGMPPKAAVGAASNDMAAQLLEFSKAVKDRSDRKAAAREIVNATQEEGGRCEELFRQEGAKEKERKG